MARITVRRLSELAITALFLALVRTLAEYYRLRYVRGTALGLADVAPYITGGLMAAVGAWAAVVAYFFGRYRVATGIVVTVVVAMLVYKVVVIGGLP
jgi:sugar phosphate permease